MSQNTQPAWEDIVFEKRNKEYGAYSIRMHYSDNVLRGTLFVGLLVAMFIASSQFRSAVKKVVAVPFDSHGGTILDPPPVIQPVEVQQQVKQVVKKGIVKDVYKVTTQTVVDLPNPPDEVIAGATNGVETPGPEVFTSAVGGEPGGEEVAIAPPVDIIHNVVEIMPTFEGGLSELSRYLQRRLKYPSSARRQGIEGTVFVSFVINGAGEVTDVHVMKGIYHDCDVEAARVVAAMPKWKAGKQHNRFVSVRMVLPITFALAH